MHLTEYHRLGLHRLTRCLMHGNDPQQPRHCSKLCAAERSKGQNGGEKLSSVFVLTQIAALCHQVHRDVSDGDG